MPGSRRFCDERSFLLRVKEATTKIFPPLPVPPGSIAKGAFRKLHPRAGPADGPEAPKEAVPGRKVSASAPEQKEKHFGRVPGRKPSGQEEVRNAPAYTLFVHKAPIQAGHGATAIP